MFWMIVTRFFCKTETLREFPCTLKAGIFSLKTFSLLSLKSVFDFFITLEWLETREDIFDSILEIIEYVVSSLFVKAEADSVEYIVLYLKRSVRLH